MDKEQKINKIKKQLNSLNKEAPNLIESNKKLLKMLDDIDSTLLDSYEFLMMGFEFLEEYIKNILKKINGDSTFVPKTQNKSFSTTNKINFDNINDISDLKNFIPEGFNEYEIKRLEGLIKKFINLENTTNGDSYNLLIQFYKVLFSLKKDILTNNK